MSGVLDVDAALTWAGSAVGSAVVSHERLAGGLTSQMLALAHDDGSQTVLRLMTNEPWRTHGAELTTRERDAQQALAGTPVPVPTSLALDAGGTVAGVAAHLMSRLPGRPREAPDADGVRAMAGLLATIHAQRPAEPFRTYQSWAWPEKWVVPGWTRHTGAWERAFEVLARPAPAYDPTFLHRDFGHRNLLWTGGRISGVVDWVETSTGPAWLDAAHAASTLAVLVDAAPAEAFLEQYATVATSPADPYWLVMDAVGHLPPPGRPPLFRREDQLRRLDDWLDLVVRRLS
ncbi:Ser/Thr protein kinase RdoA (MazF antagonist) [Nocardioides cavernae]|uniref:Ser/Thr protein kinase RdoA (MazF antagonist) n=1 Tax=Nocardioides cavernae TaxID=1921566 RepID=A0A7Y9H462_9ACTN|nr:aminoglycoside phosphotransferase family protein [Nocardioides cavernae]NYE37627.1 Ser/Thr protein kinase RdoA (MazF antagonist) [Nocardioides cavernae]